MESVLALVACMAFLIRLVPQPIKLARTGETGGVSPLAALNAVVVALAWTVHGLVHAEFAVWSVAILSLVPTIWTCVLLRSQITRRHWRWALAGLVVIAVAPATPVGALVLSSTVLISNGPQVVSVIRERDLSGLSTATWWWMVVDGLTWGSYGWTLGDQALVGYGIACLAMSAIVLDRLRRRGASLGPGRSSTSPR